MLSTTLQWEKTDVCTFTHCSSKTVFYAAHRTEWTLSRRQRHWHCYQYCKNCINIRVHVLVCDVEQNKKFKRRRCYQQICSEKKQTSTGFYLIISPYCWTWWLHVLTWTLKLYSLNVSGMFTILSVNRCTNGEIWTIKDMKYILILSWKQYKNRSC
jgi:hypothetical protein